jgi:type IV pilus assembly protein PilB
MPAAKAIEPQTLPPDAVEAVEESIPPSGDSPDAMPEIEAHEIIPKPRRGPAVPMVALTLLDGTTIQLPRRGKTPSTAAPSETELTARDLVSALRAVAHGADASEILGGAPRWESIVATLLSVLLKKGLIADWEFLEEYKKS